MASDKYNPNGLSHNDIEQIHANLFLSALVNKGNCLFVAGDYEKAREYYQEALSVESLCAEALYNIGMFPCQG